MRRPFKCLLSRREFLAAAGTAAALPVLGDAPLPGPRKEAAAHEARFYEPLADQRVRCSLCPRHCTVLDGHRGYCRVRENRGGKYYTLVYGRPVAANLDPVEKKPFFHVHPGGKAYSIATVGCNFHCKFCQNWDISQARPEDISPPYRSPEDIARAAAASGARMLAFTYNEPTIFYEYLHDCAAAAKAFGLDCLIISNGFIEDAPQRTLFPLVKAIKIDLKAFTETFYRDITGGRLQPVLDTLKRLAGSGVWFEIVTLLIPTLNDDTEDLKRLAGWVVKELGPDVPLHFTRYTPLYRLRNLPPTPPETLLKARALAMAEGCRFVYTGNVPGLEGQDTLCPGCKRVVIQRYSYRIEKVALSGGRCAACGTTIPGVWD